MDKEMNKVTLYRQGCIKFCDMYVEMLKQRCVQACPKAVAPFEGMDEHLSKQERELFCDNVIECAKCKEKHFEDLKDTLLAQFGIRRTWRDKQ